MTLHFHKISNVFQWSNVVITKIWPRMYVCMYKLFLVLLYIHKGTGIHI